MTQTPLSVARAAWGEPLPDWVETLAIQSGRTSQNAVAKLLGRSGAIVSQVLRKTYKADMARVEERVRGVFMDGRVACPYLGEIAAQTCQDWRDQAGKTCLGGPLRDRMHMACNKCPRFLKEDEQ